jgi:hypothetical protein
VVDLKRRVLDAVLAEQNVFELAPPSMAVLTAFDEHVCGERREAGRDRPDVEIVDFDDAGDLHQAPADLPGVHASGRPLEQDVDRVAKHGPRAREDQHRDRDARKRVGIAPAGYEDRERGEEDARRTNGVRENVA